MARIDKLSVHRCHVRFDESDGKTACIIDVSASPKPVYTKTDKGDGKFFVRVGNTTREYETKETVEYIAHRWGLTNK